MSITDTLLIAGLCLSISINGYCLFKIKKHSKYLEDIFLGLHFKNVEDEK